MRISIAINLCRSAGVVLAVTGVAKVLSVFGSAEALNVSDPLFAVPFRYLLLAVAVAELAIAFLCLCTDKTRLSAMLVAWLATDFVVYRLGLRFVGWHRPCGCLGNLSDMLHLSIRAADIIMKALLAYVLVASYVALVCLCKQARRPDGSEPSSASGALGRES